MGRVGKCCLPLALYRRANPHSVALALSPLAGAERDIIVALAYCIVVFSILGQGLTIGRVIRRFMPPPTLTHAARGDTPS